MKNFPLPPLYGSETPVKLPDARHVTLVGASGAGKSRFMEEMQLAAGRRACVVRAVDDSFPPLPVSLQGEFIAALSAAAAADTTLFRRIRREWETIFPANRILVMDDGELQFRTSAGRDLIDLPRLSRGERAALYFIYAVLSAPKGGVIFVDSPTLFIHPTLVEPLWSSLERLRPDCRFVYDTTDTAFVNSRLHNVIVWVKAFHAEASAWDYELLSASDADKVAVDLIGSRRPVLFIEGDAEHSIDVRLYSLVFPDYMVRPLGSCDKVIETTRTFRYLSRYHPLDTIGIVDRDRRTESEVAYLRQRSVMVAEVAEVENIFLAEPVVRAVARSRGLDPDKVMRKVADVVFAAFADMYEAQALQHTRYQVKRDVERKIDGRFTCITALELHIKGLIHTLRPRECYNRLINRFETMLRTADYAGIIKVFNHKPLLTASRIPSLLGFSSSDEYVGAILETLRSDPEHGPQLREAVLSLFNPPAVSPQQQQSVPDRYISARKRKGARRSSR